jgi:hypothetical protein
MKRPLERGERGRKAATISAERNCCMKYLFRDVNQELLTGTIII